MNAWRSLQSQKSGNFSSNDGTGLSRSDVKCDITVMDTFCIGRMKGLLF